MPPELLRGRVACYKVHYMSTVNVVQGTCILLPLPQLPLRIHFISSEHCIQLEKP
jgi:hypothetical protein